MPRPEGRARNALALAVAALAGCVSPGSYTQDGPGELRLASSFSAVPNLGIALAASQRIARTSVADWSFELQGTFQPFDDEDLIPDGNPRAGDFAQVELGVLASFAPRARRHFTARAGITWMRFTGEPNVVNVPGDYVGGYVGVGYETELGPHLTMGPELGVAFVGRETELAPLEPVPRFAWRLSWRF